MSGGHGTPENKNLVEETTNEESESQTGGKSEPPKHSNQAAGVAASGPTEKLTGVVPGEPTEVLPKASAAEDQHKANVDNSSTEKLTGVVLGEPTEVLPNASAAEEQHKANVDNSSTIVKRIKLGVDNVLKFYKSDFASLMAYTTLTSLFAGTFGALVAVYAPRFIGLDNDIGVSQSSPASVIASTPAQPNFTDWQLKLDQCVADQLLDKQIIGNLTKNVTSMRDNVTTEYKKLNENVTFRNFIVESQMMAFRDVFMSKEWIFFVLLMALFEVAVVGMVWVMWQKLAAMTMSNHGRGEKHRLADPVVNGRPSRSVGGSIQGDWDIINKVTTSRLQSRVCVISFHSETIDDHTDKVKAILSQNEATKHVTTIQYQIRSHQDILEIPPSKLCLVFVDFNERNVILEDPNKGLGDLRLTTVQAIDKMGGDVVLTYSRDKGSNKLKADALYNTDLASVKHHSELRRLDNKQRMFSVFEKFNRTQSDRIVEIVKAAVK